MQFDDASQSGVAFGFYVANQSELMARRPAWTPRPAVILSPRARFLGSSGFELLLAGPCHP